MRAPLVAAVPIAVAASVLLAAVLARGASPADVPADSTGAVRVPRFALPLQPLWVGSFAGPAAFGANLTPGPDHEAEGPPAVAAAGDGFAVLDGLRGAVRIFDASGAPVRELRLDALGGDGTSALDLAVDDRGSVAVWLARAPGAVALFEASGALSARVVLDPARSPATGLALISGQLYAGFGDVRAFQPLRPIEPLRRGLPTPGGDCNAALLGDGRAIARCHTPAGLRELAIEPDADGPSIAAVELVHADTQGGLSAVIALRVGKGELHRLAVRVDARGREAWADLGADAPWFTPRGAAFTADGRLLRLSGDAAGPRVLTSTLRPVGPAVTP